MTRLPSLTREIAQAMEVSFNGETFATIAPRVESGEMALVKHNASGAYAIVSQSGDSVCIEAIEGKGGAVLFRELVAAATQHGYKCEAWALSESRARLAKCAGMRPTGATRISGSGRVQFQVRTQ